jgi:hypothetical protein
LLWVRPGGNVAIDPLPLSPHDRKHLDTLGGLRVRAHEGGRLTMLPLPKLSDVAAAPARRCESWQRRCGSVRGDGSDGS